MGKCRDANEGLKMWAEVDRKGLVLKEGGKMKDK